MIRFFFKTAIIGAIPDCALHLVLDAGPLGVLARDVKEDGALAGAAGRRVPDHRRRPGQQLLNALQSFFLLSKMLNLFFMCDHIYET